MISRFHSILSHKTNQEADGSWNLIKQSETVLTYSGNFFACHIYRHVHDWSHWFVMPEDPQYATPFRIDREGSQVLEVAFDFCDSSVLSREDGIIIRCCLLLYERYLRQSCRTFRFLQKLQVTLKAQKSGKKAAKILGCCEFDGMGIFHVQIVSTNKRDSVTPSLRHQFNRSSSLVLCSHP